MGAGIVKLEVKLRAVVVWGVVSEWLPVDIFPCFS